MNIHKIISGGQSGVDRAALDFSLRNKINCGGWCPKNRMAEDGEIPLIYPLKETTETEPIYRTRKNVDESDGTLIIYHQLLDNGSLQTEAYARNHGKTLFLLDLSETTTIAPVGSWARRNKIKILNIAGPRESNSPGIYNKTLLTLEKLLYLF